MMVYSGWYVFVYIINIYGEYKFSSDVVEEVLILAFIFYVIYVLGYVFLKIVPDVNFSRHRTPVNINTIEKSHKIFLLIGMLGLSMYIIKNGFVLLSVADQGYEQKNIANAGSGFYRILYSVGFSYYIAARLILYSDKVWQTTFLAVVIGFFIFVSIGGGRASALMPLVTCFFFMIYSRKIDFVRVVIIAFFLFFLIFLGTLSRYSVSLGTLSDELIVSLLYKLQGSFSPADSVGTLIINYGKFEFFPEGIMNNIYYFVPRFIWNAKPIILENASGYFTKEILNYPVELTISVTLIGELLLYGGYKFLFFGAFLISVYVRSLDFVFYNANKHPLFLMLYMTSFMGFFSLMREGISVSIRDMLLSLVLTVLVFFLFRFFSFMRSRF